MKALITLFTISLLTALPVNAESLQADPANDLYTVAQLSFQQATKTKGKQQAQQEYTIAKKWFSKFLEEFPEHENATLAHYSLGKCHQKIGDSEAAMQEFLYVLSQEITGEAAANAALQLGISRYGLKLYEEAIEYLKLSCDELPDGKNKTFSYYVKGFCHKELNQSTAFLKCFNYVLNNENGKSYHAKCNLTLGRIYLKNQQYIQAFQHYVKCTNDTVLDTRSEAVHKCALLSQKLGDTENATKYFKRVLVMPSLSKWHPSSALALIQMAADREEWQKVARYEKFGNAGLSETQSHARLLLLAKSYQNTGNQKKANKLYYSLADQTRGTKVGFEVSYLLISKDGLETPLKKINAFLHIYEADFADDPRYESVKLLRAEVLYNNKDFPLALTAYQRLNTDLITTNNVPTVAFRICKLLLNGDSPSEAFPLVEQFNEKYPEDSRALNLLYESAVQHVTLQLNPEAIIYFENVSTHPKSTSDIQKASLEYLAQLYIKENKFTKATTTYKALKAKYPSPDKQATWDFWLGYSYFKTDLLSEARTAFISTRKKDAQIFTEEISMHLALIHYADKDYSALEKEVITYDSFKSAPLPSQIYVTLGVQKVKIESWKESWKWFTRCLDTDEVGSLDHWESTYILQSIAKAAIKTGYYNDARAVTKKLKKQPLAPYEKALNLYRSGLSQYQISGAKVAQIDTEAAIRINPAAPLKYKLLLLAGLIEMDLGEDKNGTRLLKQVIHFSGDDLKDTKQQALERMILYTRENPSLQNQKELAQYQKELEQID